MVKKKYDRKKRKKKEGKGIKKVKKAAERTLRNTGSLLRKGFKINTMQELMKLGKKYGYTSEVKKDYGFGSIDLVCNIKFHPGLEPLKCGFIRLREQEGGTSDLADHQFSLRKIEEAIMTGMRSGMDKMYLVCNTEEIAKSVIGQIEWLASHGSIIRLDGYASAFVSGQKKQMRMTPSQSRHERKLVK
ncbi:MAG TPA: hypothetical protein VE548_08335 [Nitrososphaeraceae archaeon]|jgi:hypothetical protein|nr:hypothetical protein [Nitrososphaeraceae archaeon]